MVLLTQHDFETVAGQKRIITTIHSLEQKIVELDRLVHKCLRQEGRLEQDIEGLD